MKSTRNITKPKPVADISLKSLQAGKALLIGGCMRSGTTIMGTLIGSLQQVEYFFEPAFLHKFLYKIGEIPPQSWKDLFEAFLYDELLLNALSGRNLNFNAHDGSHIYKRKSEQEIAPRLNRSYRRLELEHIAKGYLPSFKLPDIIFISSWLRSWYPEMKLLFLYRNANDVLNSLLRKGWNSDEQLHISSPAPLRDYEIVGEMRVPKWVHKDDQLQWLASSELERCAYYYIRINQTLIEEIDHALVVSYDAFVQRPQEILETISTQWNLEAGDKTESILQSIRLQPSPRENLIPLLSPQTQQELHEINSFFHSYSKDNYLC